MCFVLIPHSDSPLIRSKGASTGPQDPWSFQAQHFTQVTLSMLGFPTSLRVTPFPKPHSQWTFTLTPELVPSPAPLQHSQPLIPCGRGWCPPGCCCRQGKSHEGRVRDAAAAISSELSVSLLRLSRLPADNLHTEFVFLEFVFSTSLLFSSMNSASPLALYLSWQNCFSS